MRLEKTENTSSKMCFRLGQALILCVFLWLVVLLYLVFPLWKLSENEEKLVRAQNEIVRLSLENDELQDLLKSVQEQLDRVQMESKRSDTLKELNHKGAGKEANKDTKNVKKFGQKVSTIVSGPTKHYELARRKIHRDENEFWFYIRSRLEQAAKQSGDEHQDLGSMLNATVSNGLDRYNVILKDLDILAENDGHAEWRLNEANALRAIVQNRLKSLQNPSECSSARKLVCNLNKDCGYGCQIHHAVYCFIVAYGTERTLILKSHGWRYNKKGFEDVFLPLSEQCAATPPGNYNYWPSLGSPVIELPIVDLVKPKPKFMPPAIPQDLSERIIRLHGDPIVWWVSEFLCYILRPQPDTARMLEDMEKSLGFAKPIVGIHVRRTDKVGMEAAFHPVEEYMKYVEEYYERLEIKDGKKIEVKRVYVASDDAKVLSECRLKYPDYTFLGDPSVAQFAAESTRYTSSSLKGILSDIQLLSKSDYLVCTFSSQVCRIAYEMMQQNFVDAAHRFKSLDDIWYFGGQDEHQQVAILDHFPQGRDEIEILKGDVIGVAGNHWDGFNKGLNHRSNRIGLYPEYKTSEQIKVVDFPNYAHMDL